MILHRGRTWRTWYGRGWHVHFFPYGIHVVWIHPRRPRNLRRFHQWRIGVCTRSKYRPGVRLVDYSYRVTKSATAKPTTPCWRFWVAVGVGRRGGRYYDHPDATLPSEREAA